MQSNPAVSVIIPVYNREKHLCECLDSVLNQTLRDIEIICVDDGSADGSRELLSAYQQKDPRVRVLLREHGGAGPARNAGIEAAQGKYIAFLDSDDMMEPSALRRLYEHAEPLAAELTLCGYTWYIIDKNDSKRVARNINVKYLPAFEPFSAQSHSKYIFQITGRMTWAKLFLREFVQKNKLSFLASPRSEDISFSLLSLVLAERLALINEPLIIHRIDRQSASLEQAKDRFPLAAFEGYGLTWQKLEELGLVERLRQSLINALCESCTYHFNTFKTVESYRAFYDAFRTTVIPRYGIDFSDSSFFYSESIYGQLKAIAASESFEACLFSEMKRRQEAEKKTADLNKNLKKQNARLKRELDGVRKSASFRVGRAITFVPRKLRGGVKCLQEHGAAYTADRLLAHLKLKK